MSPRTGDRAWRVGYGDDSGRSVLMPTEFQSDTDADMDLRSREYGLLGYQAAKRWQPDRDGSVRLVPVVIYSGGPKWAASYPGWAQPRANVTASGEPWLEARTSCVLLDADSCGGDDFERRGNLVAALLRMNVLTELDATVEVLAAMARWLRRALPPERAALVIHELVDWWAVCSRHAVAAEQVERVRGTLALGGSDDMMALARTAREWPRIWREEGHRTGQGELLEAMAERKFGTTAATALASRLARFGDASAFVEVSTWILECNTASELLARVDALPPVRG